MGIAVLAASSFWSLFNSEDGRPINAPAILLALATTAVLVTAEGPGGALLFRSHIISALVAAFLASVAGARLTAPLRWPWALDVAGQTTLAALAAAAVWFSTEASLFAPTFYAGLAIAGAAAALPALRSASSYWAWLEKLQDASKLPLAAALVAWAAIYATLWSAHLLFGHFVDSTIWMLSWQSAAILFCAVAPIGLLLRAPPVVESPLKDDSDFLRRAQRLVGHWTLAPFIFVYSALLWLYAGKVAFAWTLPANEIGRMVGAFGAVAVLAIFLIFPDRERGPWHIRLLWRIWPYLLPAPLILVGCALAARVEAYGLTPDRYAAALLIALCAAGGVVALTDRERYIRFAPAAATLSLLAASFGPWGAVETSVRWQSAVLAKILAAHGLLKDGKLDEAAEPAALSASESEKWSSADDVLHRFGGPPSFGAKELPRPDGFMRLRSRVRLAGGPIPPPVRTRFRSMHADTWIAPTELAPFSLVGPVAVGGVLRPWESRLKATLDGSRLAIARGETKFVFDLARAAQRLDETVFEDELSEPLIVAPETADGSRLLIENMSLEADDHGRRVTSLHGLLLERRAAP